MTLVYALLMHGVLILGFNFDLGFGKKELYEPGMEITLVNPKIQQQDQAADFLANAAQQGGGNVEKKERPTTRLKGTPDPNQPELLNQQSVAGAITPPEQTTEILAVKKPDLDKVPSKPLPKEEKKEKKHLNSALLLSQAREFAQLEAQLAAQQNAYAKLPRKKYLSASTKEYKYSAYLEHWRAKVEEVGNLNYPQAASSKGLTGSLRLTVELNPDGTVRDILIHRSSGYQVLDQAAMHIINLAAPFAAFPEAIRKETDILIITRTWQFLSGNRLSSK